MKKEPKKIGMLTPSSNCTLEPVCSRMLHHVPEVTCHYSRFPVTKITLDEEGLNQFHFEPMLQAAELLAHAEVDVIAWNGTSGAWLGFDVDRELCEEIKKRTGIPATTSMLAQLEAFAANHVKKIHIVAPYIDEINQLMAKEYEKCGLEVVNIEGLGTTDVKVMRNAADETVENMIKSVSSAPADGISIVCTAFPAVHKLVYYEEKYNQTIYDTIPVVIWESMRMMDMDPRKVKGWGKLFEN